jgi:hypothetical protein
MKSKLSRAGRAVSRAQQIWAELDYAQRRLFEVRTGIPSVPRENRRGAKHVGL